jgi:hypothetical protein
MKPRILLQPFLLFAALIATSCSDDRTRAVRRLGDAARSALSADVIQLKTENFAPDTNTLVLLVGENHASVKTQKQLAEVIGRLLKTRTLDSILIEGSNGVVGSQSFRQQMLGTGKTADELTAYWQQQLDRGLIAGYEFVSLTQPGLEIFGVEDMAAKARNAAFLGDDGLRKQAQSSKRGVTVLEETLASLPSSQESGDIASEISAFRDAANEYAQAIEKLIVNEAPTRPLETEHTVLQSELTPAIRRLNAAKPSFDEYLAWSKEEDALVAPFRSRIEEVQRLQKLQSAPSSNRKSQLDLRTKAARLESDFAAIKPKLDVLKANIAAFEDAHRSDLAILNSKWQRFSELSKALQIAQTQLRPTLEEVATANVKSENAYFIAANHLCEIAGKQKFSCAKIRSFFKDENERLQNDQSTKVEDLAERDNAMADNTLNYVRSHPDKKITLLVVGYAHVRGMEAKLRERSLSFLSGKITASEDPIEPWEEMAWSQRQRAGQLVFATSSELKEVSQLLNDNWKLEQVAKLRFFDEIGGSNGKLEPSIRGLAWGDRIFENIAGKQRSMRTGKFPFDPNADYGDYVVDRGPVPGKPGEFYEVIDRAIGGAEAKRQSDANTAFVFYQKTKLPGDDKATYRLTSGSGAQSVKEFVAKAPDTSNVVLFGEADEILEGDVVVSPLWKNFRSGGAPPGDKPPGGNGPAGGEPPGGKPPRQPPPSGDEMPNGGWWTSAFLALDKGKRPQLLRTINPARAHRNLAALAKQETRFFGDMQFLEERDLPVLHEKLKFTPERGDNAQMVVLIGRNVPELRAAMKAAAEARLLRGKQVALIVCGDSFGETAALRETLLREGALMVWTNDRQITYEAGARLRDEVRKAVEATPPEQRKTIDKLMDRALRNWYEATPNDPDLRSFEQATTFVLIECHGRKSRIASNV